MTPDASHPSARFALPALVAGALGIAFAPILAKLAVSYDAAASATILSPAAIAFWRMALAAPFFLVPLAWRRHRTSLTSSSASPLPAPIPIFSRLLVLPGLCFAVDLGIWHWSFEFTSVANSTLEANFAVVVVTLVSWLCFDERPTPRFVLGAVLALAGIVQLVGASFVATGDAWIGDLMGIGVAFAYAGYQLTTKAALRRYPLATVMATTCVGAAVFLGLGAALSPGRFVPATGAAWLAVVALALVSQVFGQGLIAFGMARVSASLASVTLVLQPVMAAVLGWIILGQALTAWQGVAGALVLAGIYLARQGSKR